MGELCPKDKTMKLMTFFAAIALVAATFTSCKKDKENPVITITSPDEHSDYKWGDKVHMDADITDDRNLKHLHAFVGDADGNHMHNFDLMVSEDISGESYHFHEHFVVPDSAPAVAWVYFEVKDAEDKLTEMKWMLHFEE